MLLDSLVPRAPDIRGNRPGNRVQFPVWCVVAALAVLKREKAGVATPYGPKENAGFA
jgi:hypothetical protein